MGESFIPPALTWHQRLRDALFFPVMWVLHGGKFPLQRTHKWHSCAVDCSDLHPNKGVEVTGDDPARYDHSKRPHFHIPLIGGLTHYVVVEVAHEGPWYVGWSEIPHDTAAHHVVHRLPVKTRRLKMLSGGVGMKYYAFALDEHGIEIPLKIIGKGKLGDKKYPGAPLY